MATDIKIEGITKGSNQTWKVYVNARSYSVDDLGLLIIKQLCLKKTNVEIKSVIIHELGEDITLEQIESIRRQVERPKVSGNYIKFKVKILNLDNHTKLLDMLSIPFSIWGALIVIPLFVFILAYTQTYWNWDSQTAAKELLKSPWISIAYALLSLIVLLVHELGHASASHRYKVRPKSIGFGFYIFFPVLYTDVTASWLANRTQRVIIDLGGFYFQIILMLFFIPLGIILDLPKVFISIFVWDNIFIILYNLNPLFRFDGYWILSDLFGITNLRTKADLGIVEIIKKITAQSPITSWQYSPFIYTYGIFSYVFILIFWGGVLSVFCSLLSTVLQHICLGRLASSWGWGESILVFKFVCTTFILLFSTKTLFMVFAKIAHLYQSDKNNNRTTHRPDSTSGVSND